LRQRDNNGGEGALQDARFASMHRDPRFSRFPKKNSTVEIDKRFSGLTLSTHPPVTFASHISDHANLR
jgi:hypothetical protein